MKTNNSFSKDLFSISKDIILENQSSTGAYMASPNFSRYRYCWFRDGSYIAYAMDIIQEYESSQKFHDWAAATINKHAKEARLAIENKEKQLSTLNVLHTRYTMDGEVVDHEWANFQLDGFGTWLWAIREHIRLCKLKVLPESWKQAIILTREYLTALWFTPNYDCWEENPNKIHPYTIASIWAGLHAADLLLDEDTTQKTQESIKEALFTKGVYQGHFIKSFGVNEIDASLIGISTPYRLIEPDDPIMMKTVEELESVLRKEEGGVHRFRRDTYYGGGEWVLLTAWLGWYYTEVGNHQKANDILKWVEKQTDENQYLPEQVPTHVFDPIQYDNWFDITGDIANPLLWSHAMYLILYKALQTYHKNNLLSR